MGGNKSHALSNFTVTKIIQINITVVPIKIINNRVVSSTIYRVIQMIYFLRRETTVVCSTVQQCSYTRIVDRFQVPKILIEKNLINSYNGFSVPHNRRQPSNFRINKNNYGSY